MKNLVTLPKSGMTKEESAVIKGLAIWMMVYHHRFNGVALYGGHYHSLLNFGGVNLEQALAWFCKLCVALYAFVSGYGMFYSLRKGDETEQNKLFPALLNKYRIVLKRLWNFYRQYWLVLIVYVLLNWLLYRQPILWKELLANLLGISSSYNGSWWYVFQYVKMMAAVPILDVLFIRFPSKTEELLKWILPVCVIGAGSVLWGGFFQLVDWIRPAFTAVFVMGYLFAKYSVYQRLNQWMIDWRKGWAIAFCLAVLGAVICLRVVLAKDADYAQTDFLIAPIFIYSLLYLLRYLKNFSRILAWFGGYSTYIWLFHLFFFGQAFERIVLLTGWSTGIYLTLMGLSTLTALVLAFLERKIFNNGKRPNADNDPG